MDEDVFAYVKELGDKIYIQSPVQVYAPDPAEIETFAFKGVVAGLAAVKDLAPNPNILWGQGRYVEAERANANADFWTAETIALQQITPTLMPVSVMHDLRAAVGVIAHTTIRLPKDDPATIPRPRLENYLAVWAHRFPATAEEMKVNAAQGTLMQSMECQSPYHDCSQCGAMLIRTPDWLAEWKAHCLTHDNAASGDVRAPARILRGVVFTGTGLIFGTRGATGAYTEAHVEVEALAEFHAKSHQDHKHKPKPTRRNTMEIDDKAYQDLVAKASQAEATAATATARVATLEKDLGARDKTIETLEADKVKAEKERDDEKTARAAAEETANVAAMKDERLGKFGPAFVAALDKRANTKAKVHAQAGTLKDEEWTARVAELEELLDVKHDAAAAGGTGDKPAEKDESTAGLLFDREVVAAAGIAPAAGASTLTAPTREAQHSVIGGLVRPRKPVPAGK